MSPNHPSTTSAGQLIRIRRMESRRRFLQAVVTPPRPAASPVLPPLSLLAERQSAAPSVEPIL